MEEAKKYPIVFDKDCQKRSSAIMKAFKSTVIQKNRNKKFNWAIFVVFVGFVF